MTLFVAVMLDTFPETRWLARRHRHSLSRGEWDFVVRSGSRARSLLPFSRGVRRIVGVVRRVIGAYFEHRMATYAAALAYRGLFSLFPFMLLLVVLVGIFAPPDAFSQLVAEVESQSVEQVPKQLDQVIEQGREQIELLEDIARRAQKQANGELILIGIGVALWSVSALASTLADAFNTVYGLAERRSWWKSQALSLASGPVVAVVVIVAIVSLVTGSRMVDT